MVTTNHPKEEQMFRQNSARTTQLRLVARNGHNCYGKAARLPTRRLFLIDIENFCGKGTLCPCDVREAKEEIVRELKPCDGDLIVIGTSHGMNCVVCGTEWEGPRQVWKPGHDGADIALIDASREYKLDTFSSIVIVSGDGIFSTVASAVRACKRRVIVVQGKGCLSNRLRLEASDVRCVQRHMKTAA